MLQEICRDMLTQIDTYLYNLLAYIVTIYSLFLLLFQNGNQRNFGCFVSILYDRHLETQKHKNNI
jgi:hypothetical protein